MGKAKIKIRFGSIVLVKDELIKYHDYKPNAGRYNVKWSTRKSIGYPGFEPVYAIYIGYRALQNGYHVASNGEDMPSFLARTGTQLAALVVTAPNKKPFYASFDDIEVVHDISFSFIVANLREERELQITKVNTDIIVDPPNMKGDLF